MIPDFVDFPTSNVEDNRRRMQRAKVIYPICKYNYYCSQVKFSYCNHF